MSFLFGKKKTPQEILRENKRMLDKAMRELDREKYQLENQEKQLKAQIKKAANDNQMDAVRIMAKSIVRNKAAVTKMLNLKAQLQAISIRIQTLKSTNTMAQAMRGATKAMGVMNKQLNLQSLQKIMMEFEQQNQKMEMTQEMMGDAIDDVFEDANEEEETDEIFNKVLDDLGIRQKYEMANAPTNEVGSANQEAVAPSPQLVGADGAPEPSGGGASGGGGGSGGLPDDLQARLDKLRQP